VLFALEKDLPGIYNVAGDGLIPWSEAAAICGKRTAPIAPYFTELAAIPLRRLGICDLPPETLELLRNGRGVDTRKIKQAGFTFKYSSAGAVESFWQSVRLRKTVGSKASDYVYQRDVEQFFRHSPAVVRDAEV